MARERMKEGNYPVVWVTNNKTRYLVSNVLLHNQCENVKLQSVKIHFILHKNKKYSLNLQNARVRSQLKGLFSQTGFKNLAKNKNKGKLLC